MMDSSRQQCLSDPDGAASRPVMLELLIINQSLNQSLSLSPYEDMLLLSRCNSEFIYCKSLFLMCSVFVRMFHELIVSIIFVFVAEYCFYVASVYSASCIELVMLINQIQYGVHLLIL